MAALASIICRLCLRFDKSSTNVFSDTLKERQIREKVSKYLYINITSEDNKSKFVCLSCLRKIEQFDEFCQQVERNQQKLNNQLFGDDDFIGQSKGKVQEITIPSRTLTALIPIVSIPVSLAIQLKTVKDKNHAQSPKSIVLPFKNSKIAIANSTTKPVSSEDNNSDSDGDETSSPNGTSESEFGSNLPKSEQHPRYLGFPKIVIRNGVFVVRGRHMRFLISKFYRLECDKCSQEDSDLKIYTRVSKLFSHYIEVHKIKGYVVCCDRQFKTYKNMAFHLARHLQPDLFTCKECGKIVSRPGLLRVHAQYHLPDSEKPFPCSKCSKSFTTNNMLRLHEIKHVPLSERRIYACEHCEKTFTLSRSLSIHVDRKHSGKIPNKYICQECGKQLGTKGNLNCHLKSVHQKSVPVECEICGKLLKNDLTLRKHMLSHSETLFNCTECKYSSVKERNLKVHMDVHLKTTPYACGECKKSFKRKVYLEKHMTHHTGVLKYCCEFCGRKFRLSNNYYTHCKRMHPKEMEKKKQQEEGKKRLVLESQTKKEAVVSKA